MTIYHLPRTSKKLLKNNSSAVKDKQTSHYKDKHHAKNNKSKINFSLSRASFIFSSIYWVVPGYLTDKLLIPPVLLSAFSYSCSFFVILVLSLMSIVYKMTTRHIRIFHPSLKFLNTSLGWRNLLPIKMQKKIVVKRYDWF